MECWYSAYLRCYVPRMVFWFSQGKNSCSLSQKSEIKKNCLSLRKRTWSSKLRAFKWKEKEELVRSLIMESGTALMSNGYLFIESGVLREIGKRSWCRQEAFICLAFRQTESIWISLAKIKKNGNKEFTILAAY